MQTLCAFANGKGKGGSVIIGVKPSGELVGQKVSEQTFHEIAAQRDRFESPIEFEEITCAAVVTFRVPGAGAESLDEQYRLTASGRAAVAAARGA